MKENLIVIGAFVGAFVVVNHLMKMQTTKKLEPMSNATGECNCGRGIKGYCGANTDCKTCCGNLQSTSSMSGSSSYSNCCGS